MSFVETVSEMEVNKMQLLIVGVSLMLDNADKSVKYRWCSSTTFFCLIYVLSWVFRSYLWCSESHSSRAICVFVYYALVFFFLSFHWSHTMLYIIIIYIIYIVVVAHMCISFFAIFFFSLFVCFFLGKQLQSTNWHVRNLQMNRCIHIIYVLSSGIGSEWPELSITYFPKLLSQSQLAHVCIDRSPYSSIFDCLTLLSLRHTCTQLPSPHSILRPCSTSSRIYIQRLPAGRDCNTTLLTRDELNQNRERDRWV